jgi:hypothetical protein
MQQQSTLDAQPPFAGLASRIHSQTGLASVLLSYQTNWQTRLFIGATRTSSRNSAPEASPADATHVFAKISYAFSN